MTYLTNSGDMWDLIAFKTLGDCKYTDDLINANRAFVDVFIFSAGVELIIPDITPEIKKAAMPPWKR